MEFPRNMQKHCQSLYAIHNYTQSGCHQSRLLYLFSDITRTTQSVFDTSPSAHPLTTSNSASSLVQLSFGMHYHLILSLLLLWISLNHRSKPTTTKQFSIIQCSLVKPPPSVQSVVWRYNEFGDKLRDIENRKLCDHMKR